MRQRPAEKAETTKVYELRKSSTSVQPPAMPKSHFDFKQVKKVQSAPALTSHTVLGK